MIVALAFQVIEEAEDQGCIQLRQRQHRGGLFVRPWSVIAVSTILVQVPIQLQLNSGFDRAAAIRLITTDFWLRKVPLHVEGAFVLYALWRVVVR